MRLAQHAIPREPMGGLQNPHLVATSLLSRPSILKTPKIRRDHQMKILYLCGLPKKLRHPNRWVFAVFPLLKNVPKMNMRRNGWPSALFTRSQPSNFIGLLTPGLVCKVPAVLAVLLHHIHFRTLRHQKPHSRILMEGIGLPKNTSS